jgi:GTP cyclohydrolase III
MLLLRKLIVFAVTSGLAKKAWDHHLQKMRRRMPVDITEVVARPVVSADPAEHRRARSRGAGRRGAASA